MFYNLETYAAALKSRGLVKEANLDEKARVQHISYNSKDVQPGTLFICKGAHFKTEYLKGAVDAGACCYVSETEYDVECSCILVSDIRQAMGVLVNLFFENVWKKLNLIGITGTKGKSTTAYFVKYILDEYLMDLHKPQSAIISSIDTYDGVVNMESHLTTPEPIDLHTHFKNAVDSGIEYLTMEVSSQALKYGRVAGVIFGVGCYLNIGDDHISAVEHPDFEDYFQSKLALFSQSETACVSLDTLRVEDVKKAAQNARRVITFSTQDETADIYAYDIHKVGSDTAFTVRTPAFTGEFMLTIPGLFNVQNALAAIAICCALDIPQHYMYVGLMKARSSGRMEIYTNVDSKVVVIVDYAHNKMSFENLYDSVLKEFPGRRIYTVFGCPGKKAYQRRHDLGMLSGKFSDKVFLTEEDPGEEPVLDICKEIAVHVEAENCPYEIIPDRGEAIRQAIFAGGEENSVVLITGKGNETRQKRGIEYIPCPSDVEYTLKFLKEYDIDHGKDAAEKIRSFQDILPAFHKLYNKTVLIKLGGSVLEDNQLIQNIYEDISLLKMVGARVVVVHGGGKTISRLLERLGIETAFVGGYRVTDEESIGVVEMALSGAVNQAIVQGLKNSKVNAAGLSGKDGNLLTARRKTISQGEIGFVGQVETVDNTIVKLLLDGDYVPVISPISSGTAGETLNVNADDAALAIAESLGADSLVFITDVDGILLDVHNDKTLVHYLDIDKAKSLLDNGFIGGGMLPKLKNCVKSIENGVQEVVILNGTVKYNLVSNFVTPRKIGTTIGK